MQIQYPRRVFYTYLLDLEDNKECRSLSICSWYCTGGLFRGQSDLDLHCLIKLCHKYSSLVYLKANSVDPDQTVQITLVAHVIDGVYFLNNYICIFQVCLNVAASVLWLLTCFKPPGVSSVQKDYG